MPSHNKKINKPIPYKSDGILVRPTASKQSERWEEHVEREDTSEHEISEHPVGRVRAARRQLLKLLESGLGTMEVGDGLEFAVGVFFGRLEAANVFANVVDHAFRRHRALTDGIDLLAQFLYGGFGVADVPLG